MFWRRRSPDDFSSEVQAHLDLETERLIQEGLSPADARDAAHRSFGNVTAARERFYEANRWIWIEQFVQDLRYGWRSLRQSPAFVATTVLTLAVGLGLVTVAFTVFNAYFLRPFAVRDPSSLHQIVWRAQDGAGQSFRWRDYLALRDRHDLFEAVTAESTRFVSSNGRPLAVALISDNYFESLAPAVLLGRAIGAVDAGGTSGSPLVLSYQGWTRLFSRDPDVIGREVDLNGQPFVVVGVLRPEFTGLGDSPRDGWVQLTTYAVASKPELIGTEQPRSIEIVARLRPDVTATQAQSALTAFISDAAPPMPGGEPHRNVRAEVRPQSSPNPLSFEMLAVMSPIFAAFALVLVTACANVSNVMLARAIARHREIAVRLSLGASRGRVVRQLLTEGLVIAVLSGFAGLALAAWALRGATALFFRTLPTSAADILRLASLDIDTRVFMFALAVAAAATLMFALLPALQASRLPLTDALRGQRTGTRRSSRLRSALVVGQVAVSLILVILALTLARNGAALSAIDLGYATNGVVSVNVRGEEAGLVPRLAAVLSADPRVAEVAVTGSNPLFLRERSVAAGPDGAASARPTRYTFVSPEYFSILRLPIQRGRTFRQDEAASSAHVAIVSTATANAFWPGQDSIGRTIRIERPEGRPVDDLPGYTHLTVLGTVPDVVSGLLIDGQDTGHIYLPTAANGPHARALLLRGRGDHGLDPQTMQDLFRQAGPDPQVFEALRLEEMRALQMYPLLAASWVGTLLGVVALALSVSGLYGVLTYTLSQRTKEIGIRMALGASAGAVVRLVMAQSARLAGAGAAIGLAVAFAALKMLSAAIQLKQLSLLDVVAFGGGLGVVIAATALAAYYPARGAARVDPAETLRADA
jgi:predicted permease